MKYITSFIFLLGWCLLIQGQPIVEMEYFYDNDPGIGNAISLNFTGNDTVDISISGLATTSLPSGFHTLNIRAKDSTGRWSLYNKRSFYIQPSKTNSVPSLTEMEYFFDTDPGTGNGIPLNIAAGDTIDVNFTGISTTGLSQGFHTLFVRTKGADGIWGLYIGRVIYVQSPLSNQPAPQLTQAEYFFDTDPGLGNGTSLNFSMNDSIDAIFSGLSINNLSQGFHTLFIRILNEDGIWGLYQGRTFFIQEPAHQDTVPIIGFESLFDTDTGGGTGVYQALNPANEIDTVVNIPTNLPTGAHTLFVRVEDSLGSLSLVESDSFFVGTCSSFWPEVTVSDSTTFCEGDSVTLSISQIYPSYQWSNGSTNSSITVSQSGNYTITVIDTAGCSGTSNPITVNVIPNPQPQIQANGLLAFCEGDTILLSTQEPHASYLWSTGDTIAILPVSQSGAYTVTVSNGGDCEASSDTVSTTVTPIPAPISITALGGDSLLANGDGDFFRWYVNDSLMEPLTGIVRADISGVYQVSVVVNGCESPLSAPFEYWLTGIEDLENEFYLSAFPNPFTDMVHFEFSSPIQGKVYYEVFDLLGKEWLEGSFEVDSQNNASLDLGKLPNGIFFARFVNQANRRGVTLRLVKMR